jgi:branched-chain amino acid transport system substrate-binding protein
MKKRSIIIIFVFLFLVGVHHFVEAKEVKIGLVLPMSGILAQAGDSFKKAAILAFEEIIASGMLKDKDIQLSYVIEDGQCNPEPAVKATEKMLSQDKVEILIGEFCSSATLAVSAVSKKQEIPFVAFSSGATNITSDGHKWVVRTIPNNDQVNVALADLIKKNFSGATVAILYPINDWGIDADKILAEELTKAGYKIVDRLGVQANETNFYSVLTKLKGLKPKVVAFSTYGTGVPAMFRQAKEVGLDTKWVTLQQPIYEDQAGPLAYGVIRAMFFFASPQNPKAVDFEKKVKAKYNKEPDTYMAEAYDAVYVVADALKRGGATKDGFLKALWSTKNYMGVMGPITFDEKGQSLAKGRVTFVELQEGKPKFVFAY